MIYTHPTDEERARYRPEAQIGDRIVGQGVGVGERYTGVVTEVIGPIRFPDCMGYRYRLADTGEVYMGGAPVEPIVFFESKADA